MIKMTKMPKLMDFVDSALGLLPVICFVVFTAVSGTLMLNGIKERQHRDAFFRQMSQVDVIPPKDIPLPTPENIEIAELMFGIQRNINVTTVSFNDKIEDRGLTTGGLLDPEKSVLVGPAAFTSWAVLGSTLGHEIEVHCNQSFLSILLKDRFVNLQMSARTLIGRAIPFLKHKEGPVTSDVGTWAAEREAYHFELRSAARFGLSKDEINAIHQVVNFYYPSNTLLP